MSLVLSLEYVRLHSVVNFINGLVVLFQLYAVDTTLCDIEPTNIFSFVKL